MSWACLHFDLFGSPRAIHNEPENPMKFRNKKVTALIDVRSRLEFFFGHLPADRDPRSPRKP